MGKNPKKEVDMAKFADRLAATFIIFLISGTAAFFISREPAIALAAGFFFALIFNLAAQNVKLKKSDKNCSENDFFYHVMKGGQTAFFQYVKLLIPPSKNPAVVGNALVAESAGRKQAVFFGYKFSAAGADDVFRFYRAAREIGADDAYVFCRTVDRRAQAAAGASGIRFVFVNHKTFYRMLSKKKLLPEIRAHAGRPKFKTVLAAAFCRKNALPFMLSGGALALSSLLLPYRTAIYYIVIGCVCLALALICLFDLGGRLPSGAGGLFKNEE